jgi:hypothetical protein
MHLTSSPSSSLKIKEEKCSLCKYEHHINTGLYLLQIQIYCCKANHNTPRSILLNTVVELHYIPCISLNIRHVENCLVCWWLNKFHILYLLPIFLDNVPFLKIWWWSVQCTYKRIFADSFYRGIPIACFVQTLYSGFRNKLCGRTDITYHCAYIYKFFTRKTH